MSHCWELYGLDFMLEQDGLGGVRASILEVNPGPDFKQTGDRLKLVIEELLLQTVRMIAVSEPENESQETKQDNESDLGQLLPVYDKEWSVSRLQVGMEMK